MPTHQLKRVQVDAWQMPVPGATYEYPEWLREAQNLHIDGLTIDGSVNIQTRGVGSNAFAPRTMAVVTAAGVEIASTGEFIVRWEDGTLSVMPPSELAENFESLGGAVGGALADDELLSLLELDLVLTTERRQHGDNAGPVELRRPVRTAGGLYVGDISDDIDLLRFIVANGIKDIRCGSPHGARANVGVATRGEHEGAACGWSPAMFRFFRKGDRVFDAEAWRAAHPQAAFELVPFEQLGVRPILTRADALLSAANFATHIARS